MTEVLLAVPNISEGRDTGKIARIAGDTTLLDIHSDVDHNRSVLTYGGPPFVVIDACFGMIERAVAELDIGPHAGVHPRFGVVDVLPFVPYPTDEAWLRDAVAELAWRIAQGPGVPTFTYGRASPEGRPLPELRRALRNEPPVAHPTAGVICIGIRDPLVAFNVNCLGPLDAARNAARDLRKTDGIQALGLELASRGEVQLSMNLVDLDRMGAARAFQIAVDAARTHGLSVIDAEVAGLVPGGTRDEFKRLPMRWSVRTIEEALGADTISP